jgi:hypothetical protein
MPAVKVENVVDKKNWKGGQRRRKGTESMTKKMSSGPDGVAYWSSRPPTELKIPGLNPARV